MKQPKNQKELLELLHEQDQQLTSQADQIRILKQALLRLEQQVRKIGTATQSVRGAHRQLHERVKVAEFALKNKIQNG